MPASAISEPIVIPSAASVGVTLVSAPLVGVRRRYALLFPILVLLFIYLLWNSARKTLVNRGINWRGTHYPLAELKANKL